VVAVLAVVVGGGVLDAKQSRPPALANVLFLFLSVAFLP